MGLRTCLLVVLLMLSGVVSATSPSSCLPKHNSLQLLTQVDLSSDYENSYRLTTDDGMSVRDARVVLKGKFTSADGKLSLRIQWDEEFSGVSLPYNVYAALVLVNGKVVDWSDFTDQCSGAGLSLYPGVQYLLPPIDVGSSGSALVQVMIWGRIL